MTLAPFSINVDTALLADASVVINLNSTGNARAILRALPGRLQVVDIVQGELDSGKQRDRNDSASLQVLADSGLVELVRLEEDHVYSLFESLVVGPAATTLDDGEAATIAYAVAHTATAVIDEPKASGICAERFPELPVACTVDLLSHPSVSEALGDDALADAVFGALYHGRMRVLPKHRPWVVALIGQARAAECISLPQSVRLMRPK